MYGSDIYGRVVQHKSKRCIKVSLISDIHGVPLNLAIASGNVNDSKIALAHLQGHDLCDLNTQNVKNNNKYKQHLLGDSAYYTNEIKRLSKKRGYCLITDVNRRNTKDERKLDVLRKEKTKYLKYTNKRSGVERFNSWMHKYPKLTRLIEKKRQSYIGLLLLACTMTVKTKLNRTFKTGYNIN